jgi:hypothetical protein
MATPHEIRMLMDKEGNEAKAKRACQQKVYQHHLDMEILEAEFQWAAGTMWVRDHFTGERHSTLERCSPARRSCICIAPIKPTVSHFDNPPCLEIDRQARHKDNSSASFVKQPFSAVDCAPIKTNGFKINTQAPSCHSTPFWDSQHHFGQAASSPGLTAHGSYSSKHATGPFQDSSTTTID